MKVFKIVAKTIHSFYLKQSVKRIFTILDYHISYDSAVYSFYNSEVCALQRC